MSPRRRLESTRPSTKRWLLPVVLAAAAVALPGRAEARKNRKPQRKGGQAELLTGASACVPGKGDCKDDALGRTAPSLGMAANIGYRVNRFFFIGGGYGVGWFNPTWELDGGKQFRNAYQQGVFGVLRGYLPIWRLDLGLELAPGWSRQTFVPTSGDKVFSQGFALRPGLSLDFWLGRRVFVGAKLDMILNFHQQACTKNAKSLACETQSDLRQARVHQLMGGIHFGGTF